MHELERQMTRLVSGISVQLKILGGREEKAKMSRAEYCKVHRTPGNRGRMYLISTSSCGYRKRAVKSNLMIGLKFIVVHIHSMHELQSRVGF